MAVAADEEAGLHGPVPVLGEDLRRGVRDGRGVRHRDDLPVRDQLGGVLRSRRVIIGPLMAYEVMTAFFLEAGFLGVMLFGLNKVGPRLHFLATLLVAFGTFLSAFWILSANSWMHTPAGFSINDVGQFAPVNWWEVIFNPSFPYRLAHTITAAYLTTALAVGGVGAWHLLKHRRAGTRLDGDDRAAGSSLAGARKMF